MSDTIRVIFLAMSPPYNKGEIATLPAKRAEALIEARRAARDADAGFGEDPAPDFIKKPAPTAKTKGA